MKDKSRQKKIVVFSILTMSMLIVLLVGFLRRPQMCTKKIPALGTIVSVTLFSGHEDESIVQQVVRESKRVETIFSRRIEESEISRINREAHISPVTVSQEVFMLLKKASVISRETSGAFDVTVLPLIFLWKEARLNKTLPEKTDIAESLAVVGSDMLDLDAEHSTVAFTRSGMGIDVGAIAKGYAVDCMAMLFNKKDMGKFLIEAGGDMLLSGNGSLPVWRIGLQHPRESSALLGILSVPDGAVATSGDYERFFIQDGLKYHHILDPKTGYPSTACVSATVFAPSALEADAYATAFFVMGPEKTKEFLKTRKDLEAVLVTEENDELVIYEFLKKCKFEKR